MSLRHIVDTLGGDLYDGGRRASVPAPNHSAKDRSVSLLLEGDCVVVHTFGGVDWKEVLDDLRQRRLIDRGKVPINGAGVPVTGRPTGDKPSDRQRLDAARDLWSAGRPLGASTLSARHCRLRGMTGLLPGPEAFRHLAEAPVSIYQPGRARRPALLAGILDAAGVLVAVEITYLAPNGKRAMDLHLPRKTIGVPPPGCAVRLDPSAEEMLVGEGVFTTRSAGQHFGLPSWALQSTRNLRAWSPPEGVRSILIAADRGKDGQYSAEVLRSRLAAAGVAAHVALPPAPFADWNDWDCRPRAAAAV